MVEAGYRGAVCGHPASVRFWVLGPWECAGGKGLRTEVGLPNPSLGVGCQVELVLSLWGPGPGACTLESQALAVVLSATLGWLCPASSLLTLQCPPLVLVTTPNCSYLLQVEQECSPSANSLSSFVQRGPKCSLPRPLWLLTGMISGQQALLVPGCSILCFCFPCGWPVHNQGYHRDSDTGPLHLGPPHTLQVPHKWCSLPVCSEPPPFHLCVCFYFENE